VKATSPDLILITGDITTGEKVEDDLTWLSESFQEQQMLFVMGNHDYHSRSFQEVNESVSRLVSDRTNLHWLTQKGVLSLNSTTAIIGTEGWYDAALGDPSLLRYTMDWFCIHELRSLPTMSERIEMFIDMATKSAMKIEQSLVLAVQDHHTVLIATHFPPWSAATSLMGTRLERFWLPYSVNTVLGKAIENVAAAYPDKRIIVLSGHTHVPNVTKISDNVECRVSHATRWGRIREHSIIEV
jgi:predicted phosphohydrolase